ncbi:MBL fold metallo-hydrolase [Dongshaea marina]|uniref:MBL fold metallo-hydrolase n=1 Tax=Dongshaea marina TaxID=2047966 RepID=UPI000D3ED1B3|nr:MBL fold metallo-hydrolase [Dongshaea marina]
MSLPLTQPSLQLRQLFDPESCAYTYLLIDSVTSAALLIDPVREQLDRDLRLIEELGVQLMFTLETHVHADHITSSGQIRQQTGAKIGFSAAANIAGADISLKEGDSLPLGQHQIRAIATPGHTSGCTCYYVDGMLFSGDTLLIRGCGRADFQEGDPGALYDSVTKKLFTLPDETRVYPAHDYNGRTMSSIGEEKRWNLRLGQGRSREAFIEIMNHLNLPLPKKIKEAVPANQQCAMDEPAQEGE